jgi:hypothetical protein
MDAKRLAELRAVADTKDIFYSHETRQFKGRSHERVLLSEALDAIEALHAEVTRLRNSEAALREALEIFADVVDDNLRLDEKRARLEKIKAEKVRVTGEVILEYGDLIWLIYQLELAWDEDETPQLIKERDELRYLLSSINKHLMPGECDSVDGMRLIIKERDALKAELEQAKIDQIKWLTEHPTYKLSKQLETELDAALAREAELVAALEMYSSLNSPIKDTAAYALEANKKARGE